MSNEKQELIDLLMNYEPSTRTKKKRKAIERTKEEIELPHKKVDNIEIMPNSKSKERHTSKKKEVYTMEYKTIDFNEPKKLKKNMKNQNPEFQTMDNEAIRNTRNNMELSNAANTTANIKEKTKEITYIKNRRTGSTDCTNTKFRKREVKRISNFQKKAVVELDTDEGEMIMSNRRNMPDKNSPSLSPVKYNIEPNKERVFDMNYVMKSSNYESVKNKK